jgi:hypothetical protein
MANDRKSLLPEEFFDRVFALRGKIFDIALQHIDSFPQFGDLSFERLQPIHLRRFRSFPLPCPKFP